MTHDEVTAAMKAEDVDAGLVEKHARQAQTIGDLQDVRERLNMLRDLAEAIRQDSHCKHLANDIETLLKAPIEELRAEDAP